MNTQINAMLGDVVRRVEATEAAAWGPEQDVEPTDYETGTPGTLGATNVGTAWDSYDAYFGEIIDSLMATYEVSEDDAVDLIYDVLDEMIEEGLIEEMPEDESPEEEVAVWLGKAKSVGLHIAVGEAAKEVF